jgi:putative peptidoglycan lipid II flippase
VFHRFSTLFDQKRLAGGAFALAVTQFGASLAGLVRDRILFQTFPPGSGITDVYFASFRPSDFLFQACIVSALGTVLVPVLAAHHAHGRADERDKVLSGTMYVGAMAFGVIALLLAAFLPRVAPYLVAFEGERLELYVRFGRLALLSNFLFVFGSTLGQHLITVQRYWVYGLTPILYTVGTILGTILLTPSYGAYGPMLGTVAGALVYALVRAAGVLHSGARFRRTLWHPELKGMGWLMLPRVLSLGALQLQLLLFDRFGSGLATGSVSVNLASRNFQSVAVGCVGIALAQAVYSPLSQAAARGDVKAYVVYLKKALLLVVGLTVPCAVALVLLAPVAATLVSIEEVFAVFRWTLLFYAVSIPFESANHLLLRSYYALRDTLLPALSAVAAGLMACVAAWVLLPDMGVYALGIGFTVGQVMQTGMLGAFLPWRLRMLKKGNPGKPEKTVR